MGFQSNNLYCYVEHLYFNFVLDTVFNFALAGLEDTYIEEPVGNKKGYQVNVIIK